MIALLLLASQTTLPTPAPKMSPQQARFEACADLAVSDPVRALDEAGAWQVEGGGVLARQCAGLAYIAQKRWSPAATAFEAAARAAEAQSDGRSTNLWVQAGNAALAGGEAAKARGFFDAALSRGVLTGEAAGEAHLDRARALASLGDLKAARSDLDLALKLVPADPLGWLLSATLARKMGDLPRAQNDIGEAATRSPDDAGVALEAGNIALLSGSIHAARTAWEAASTNAPTSAAGQSAAEALKQLPPR